MVLGSFENLATNSAPDPLLPALLPNFSVKKYGGGGMLGGTFWSNSTGIPMELGSTGVFDRKAYITTYVVRKSRSSQDRNLICYTITPPATTQLTSFFLVAHINVKIRIEEGQNFVRAVHQKTTKTQPAHWQVYNCGWCALVSATGDDESTRRWQQRSRIRACLWV